MKGESGQEEKNLGEEKKSGKDGKEEEQISR